MSALLHRCDAAFVVRQIFGDGFYIHTIVQGKGRQFKSIMFNGYLVGSGYTWEEALNQTRLRYRVVTGPIQLV